MFWKDHYESAAEQESATYEAMSVKDLLNQVRLGMYGQYHIIWSSLSEKATLKEAAWTLFAVLQQDKLDYIIRYHCAKALLELMGRQNVVDTPDEIVNLTRGPLTLRLPYLMDLQKELSSLIGQSAAV